MKHEAHIFHLYWYMWIREDVLIMMVDHGLRMSHQLVNKKEYFKLEGLWKRGSLKKVKNVRVTNTMNKNILKSRGMLDTFFFNSV
jgi:hypothetical protein